MSKQFKLVGLSFGAALATLILAVALSAGGGTVPTVSAQSCDPAGSTDGVVTPTAPLANEPVTFEVWNFTAGENVSFWFTLPSGGVFGTANPLCCASGDGHVRFAPAPLPSAFYQVPG